MSAHVRSNGAVVFAAAEGAPSAGTLGAAAEAKVEGLQLLLRFAEQHGLTAEDLAEMEKDEWLEEAPRFLASPAAAEAAWAVLEQSPRAAVEAAAALREAGRQLVQDFLALHDWLGPGDLDLLEPQDFLLDDAEAGPRFPSAREAALAGWLDWDQARTQRRARERLSALYSRFPRVPTRVLDLASDAFRYLGTSGTAEQAADAALHAAAEWKATYPQVPWEVVLLACLRFVGDDWREAAWRSADVGAFLAAAQQLKVEHPCAAWRAPPPEPSCLTAALGDIPAEQLPANLPPCDDLFAAQVVGIAAEVWEHIRLDPDESLAWASATFLEFVHGARVNHGGPAPTLVAHRGPGVSFFDQAYEFFAMNPWAVTDNRFMVVYLDGAARQRQQAIDAGGLTKDFFAQLQRDVLDTGLLRDLPDGTWAPLAGDFMVQGAGDFAGACVPRQTVDAYGPGGDMEHALDADECRKRVNCGDRVARGDAATCAPPAPEALRLEALGLLLARFLVVDPLADEIALSFRLHARVLDALQDGRARGRAGTSVQGYADEWTIPACEDVAALFHSPRRAKSAGPSEMGPYGRSADFADTPFYATEEGWDMFDVTYQELHAQQLPDGTRPSWAASRPGWTDEVPVAQAREFLQLRCEKFLADRWDAPLAALVRGWASMLGPPGDPGDGAPSVYRLWAEAEQQGDEVLRDLLEAADHFGVDDVAGAVEVECQRCVEQSGSAPQCWEWSGCEPAAVKEKFKAALQGVEAAHGEAALFDLLQFWTGTERLPRRGAKAYGSGSGELSHKLTVTVTPGCAGETLAMGDDGGCQTKGAVCAFSRLSVVGHTCFNQLVVEASCLHDVMRGDKVCRPRNMEQATAAVWKSCHEASDCAGDCELVPTNDQFVRVLAAARLAKDDVGLA